MSKRRGRWVPGVIGSYLAKVLPKNQASKSAMKMGLEKLLYFTPDPDYQGFNLFSECSYKVMAQK
jgi:hypothetical protein